MSRPHIVAPSELSSLRDLELLARTTVEGLRQGLHRSPFHGFNAEFSQYRHYRPGDDLKYVDWKVFGRTDRLYSRQFRETTNLGALVVIDVSRSMAFPEGRDSKFELARAVAAVLIALVIDQGDAAGVLAMSGSETGHLYIPPRSGRHHLHVQLAALSRLHCEGAEPVATALRRAATLLRRRGLIILVTDFYDDTATLSEVRRLGRFGHDVINFHIVAREELELPAAESAVEFVDLETNESLVTNAQGVSREYRTAFGDFLSATKHHVEREGMDYVRLVTGDPIEPVLRRFLVGRRGGE